MEDSSVKSAGLSVPLEKFRLSKDRLIKTQDALLKEQFKPLFHIIDEIKLFVKTNKIKSFKTFGS